MELPSYTEVKNILYQHKQTLLLITGLLLLGCSPVPHDSKLWVYYFGGDSKNGGTSRLTIENPADTDCLQDAYSLVIRTTGGRLRLTIQDKSSLETTVPGGYNLTPADEEDCNLGSLRWFDDGGKVFTYAKKITITPGASQQPTQKPSSKTD